MRYGVLSVSIVLVTLAGCGGGEMPEDCRNIEGPITYDMSFDKRSGDCADLPDVVVAVDGAGLEGDDDCVVTSASSSHNECRGDFDITCASDDADDDLVLRQVGYLEIHDENADTIEGRITIDARTKSGSAICSATYDVQLSRR